MEEAFQRIMVFVGTGFDAVGVLVITLGAMLATARLARQAFKKHSGTYRQFRQDLGGAIVLGLEFLVAGDIIRSVVVAPTLENVMVLGLIVLIRTFLGFALQWELHGSWPWRHPVQTTESVPGPQND